MKLVHYGSEPISAVRSTDPVSRHHGSIGKPRGFWFSVGDEEDYGWREWCIENEFNLGCLTHVHDIELAPEARILRITGAAELDAFAANYARPMYPMFPDEPALSRLESIDWGRVAEQWQGIIIAPYVWSRRLDLMWYYTWDCSSGCIWDASAIASITLRARNGA